VGSNTTLASAQAIDISDATNVPLFNAALAAFDMTNSVTIHQDSASFSLGGQAVSPKFYPFGVSTDVNAAVDAIGHLTKAGTAGASNFFAFTETSGNVIQLFGQATKPSTEGTSLSLYDPAGTLAALASENAPDGRATILSLNVPSGFDGTWTTSITQGVCCTAPFNYRLQQDLPLTAMSFFTTHIIGTGTEKNGALGTYDVNAMVGDDLHFVLDATSPSTKTELELFDPFGRFVAESASNGADGFSSFLDFIVPSGDAGTFRIEVAPVASAYAYDLAIQGTSGTGPVPPIVTPEPSTWALMLFGLSGISATSRLMTRRAKSVRC
jgi:hypothetical protein